MPRLCSGVYGVGTDRGDAFIVADAHVLAPVAEGSGAVDTGGWFFIEGVAAEWR